ncbi:CoA-binding protein, partial [Pseudomonadota bacterium]
MSLDSLFTPRSIAVYGASAADSRKLGNTLLANAVSGAGEVVAVHPTADLIDGIPAVASLDRPVDLALVSVPAQRVEAAVADAAAAGAKTGIILSSGFAESGAKGRANQDQIAALADAAGMRLVGPNCMGVVSHLGDGKWLNGSYFWVVPETAGGLSFVSQSGAFGGMFFGHLQDSGLGLSRFLSVGNSADVSVTDVLEWLGEDPQTTAIGMFIEGIDDGRRFVEVARRVTGRKPVVVLKAGKMAAGARAAASHTGSMAGSHEAVRAGLRRAGVI